MNRSQPRVIRTPEQYREYLSEVELLITQNLTPGSEDAERLELLTILIENYESSNYAIEPVDPIEAIKFRMAEKGLKQVDLAPYFGTKSRVSEVLSGKRALTVPMIKALSVGLGIAPQTLLGLESEAPYTERTTQKEVNWSKFPIKEMLSRGWIEDFSNKTKNIEQQVKDFIGSLGETTASASFKRTLSGDAYSPLTHYKLYAWVARVIQRSRERKLHNEFDANVLSKCFLKELAQLSWSEYGPLLAVEFLEKNGICVVIEPALKGTSVDGAALKDSNGRPIVALSLRQDRLDNFWFTLLHEVVHIWKHVDLEKTFVDDLENHTDSKDKFEAEANRLARDTFIPRVIWKRSDAYLHPSSSTIDKLSKELNIHPAIIAGRLRKESGKYNQFSDLVGYGEVRKHFPSKYW
ncbi:TPA: ImmA/IrrE family metallo-endopeptidase [Vibrio parahaemolyticus]|uniref:helix-turn-helix domain-containing protein n=2 Tax=Vibrio parahaemolyticus TaxID=670 RepID=UPI0006A62B78|nr:ImmA/IrrE family metallo-endopeptidase [Vibrio parahaemolyticus]EJB8541941.1 ImmA/IrrE family metallo-endopeptidase [Vibrio parahaemolyticus]EJG1658360.1 ImmA/IrrE family metallo-endopeptidase [Vibrio parahaemolyticus]EJG1676410.1 ImmA/IrrE family metallo-endopeptidase [Vibrio parahaemolyticus]EJG1719714.1 ImmA/IrrE family metallo-endopeptidase [Vibrio parahaemolyticus]EJG1761057.1 ImmA/IrrE family metallo-endopeptidase [Vibrio parahaemolyticus]